MRDLDWLAGFVEAEGCFQINLRNAGTSYGCEMAIQLRDDDDALLARLVSELRIGRLRSVKARGTSMPQTRWSVNRWADCRSLVAILDEHRLLGRKSADYAIWRRALEVRADCSQWKDPRVVRGLRSALRAAKQFTTVSPVRPTPATPSWGYITGLIEGDGHFGLRGQQARLVIHLRADDLPLLESIRSTTGCGSICLSPPYRSTKPSATWTVHRPVELAAVGSQIEETGMYGRKAAEFTPWLEAVRELSSATADSRAPDASLLSSCEARLKAARTYMPRQVHACVSSSHTGSSLG
jgi:hypothetical protein